MNGTKVGRIKREEHLLQSLCYGTEEVLICSIFSMIKYCIYKVTMSNTLKTKDCTPFE